MTDTPKPKQLLHSSSAAGTDSVSTTEFKDLDKVELVGVYPNYASAYTAWKARGTAPSTMLRCGISSFTASPARPRQPVQR